MGTLLQPVDMCWAGIYFILGIALWDPKQVCKATVGLYPLQSSMC